MEGSERCIAHGCGRGWGGKMEGCETGGAWVGTGLGEGRWSGSETGGAWMGDGAGEGRWRRARREGARRMGGDGELHHKHHCRLLRVSAQVERSMGGGSAAPCFAEARWEVSGAVLRG